MHAVAISMHIIIYVILHNNFLTDSTRPLHLTVHLIKNSISATSNLAIFWCYILPPSYRHFATSTSIRASHAILAFQYELSELASTGVGSTDHHPVLSATGDIIQGDGPRTASRMKACNKGKADLASLIYAFSSDERDFNFPSATKVMHARFTWCCSVDGVFCQ